MDYSSHILEASRGTELTPELVTAVVWKESRGNPNAISPAGAIGLMQIMPRTGAEIASELGYKTYDLKHAKTNICFGVHFLNKLLKSCSGDIELALTSYHSGLGRVRKLLRLHKAKNLSQIKSYLGPSGRVYAEDIIQRSKLPLSEILSIKC